ncbi:alpha/beta hydrolase fold domain-containing protein [Streptomyces sp. NPDC051985]|uniref:alpha/beta hydrolase n=1 Tax=Streptomyces sp. NPDC051985 TaxID=3155807 RepID=UPI003439AB99
MHDLTRPKIDAELNEWIWRDVPEGELPTLFQVLDPENLPAMREAAKAVWLTDDELRLGGRVEFEEREIPGYEGGPDVQVLILRPAGITGPLPALVATHCGGKVFSQVRNLRGIGFVEMVADHGIVMVVVGMRTAPEDPHPAQVHDSYAALSWTADNAGQLGIESSRIGVIGVSGGGGVAAATALFARDHGGPPISHLLLLSPMLDDRDITVSNWFDRVSHPHDSNAACWKAMLGDAKGGPTVDAYAAPSRAASFAGLPPVYIETGSADTFRDESLDLAARAGQAGVPVEIHSWGGYLHSMECYAPVPLSDAVRAARRSFLERAFGGPGTGFVDNRPPAADA